MKHAELCAILHNVADSLGSGIGLLIGVYEMDVFGEAARSPGGTLTVDFLEGIVAEGRPSSSLQRDVALYRDALVRLCENAGGSIADFREAKVRYWSDPLSPRFSVTVVDRAGRRSTTEYAGVPGRRVKVLDELGRLRPKPPLT
jgi:hypothetical protein